MKKIRLYLNDRQVEEELLELTGEWMEIGCTHAPLFRVGDIISCERNQQRQEAKVVGITQQRIYLCCPPPSVVLDPIDRRHNPRVRMELPAALSNSRQTSPIWLLEANIGGFGFTAEHTVIQVDGRYTLKIESEILSIEAQVRIMHRTEVGDKIQYGAEVVFMNREALNQLRMFLLSRQFTTNLV